MKFSIFSTFKKEHILRKQYSEIRNLKKPRKFRKINAEGQFIQQYLPAFGALSAFCHFPLLHDMM